MGPRLRELVGKLLGKGEINCVHYYVVPVTALETERWYDSLFMSEVGTGSGYVALRNFLIGIRERLRCEIIVFLSCGVK